MALTALEIYKHLPKTNCGKCASPTCLAFAMLLAAKKAELAACPDVTSQAKAALEGASAPPIRLVTIGGKDNKVEIGNETVLFRHEESFYHQTGVASRLTDEIDINQFSEKIKKIDGLKFERVGTQINIDLVAIENLKTDKDGFKKYVLAAKNNSSLNLVLMSKNPDVLDFVLPEVANKKPLLHCADESNYEKMIELGKKFSCPVAVRSDSLENLALLIQRINSSGFNDIVLDVSSNSVATTIENLTKLRRYALKKNFKTFGYPSMAICSNKDKYLSISEASLYIAKYAGVVVLDALEKWQFLTLLTVRQSIYTDPRKPVQVEPLIYSIGNVTKESPVLITTNFSITYYTVAGDVEASKVPAYVVVIDTEGTSVLTAYAAEKFTPEKIAGVLNAEGGIKDKVSHKKVIIPGYVAVLSGKLEEKSGWQIMVGPRESAEIPKYLKTVWKL